MKPAEIRQKKNNIKTAKAPGLSPGAFAAAVKELLIQYIKDNDAAGAAGNKKSEQSKLCSDVVESSGLEPMTFRV